MTKEERDRKNQEYPERAFWTGHYHYMTQALAIASQSTSVWRLTDSGTAFTLLDLFEFVKKRDEENPLDEEQFYMVSCEGAIGLSPGLEFLTKWIFIPMEPCEERDRLMEQMKAKLQEEKAVREAVEKAVDEGMKRESEQITPPVPPLPPAAPAIVPDIPAPPVPPALPKDSRYYMIDANNQRQGPFSVEELIFNNINMSTLVWKEGMAQWTRAGLVEELSDALAIRYYKYYK